ncbi:hypothetical protein Aduo_009024 [Ancylostoma duodenale]
MSDIMMLYLKKFSSCVQYYMEQRGRTTPCLKDVARAFDYMRVSRNELYEYMRQVRPMEPVLPVPMIPVPPDKTSSGIHIYFPNQDIPKHLDEKTSEASEEKQLMKPLPSFSETTAYSAGLIREPSAETPSRAHQKPKIETPLPPLPSQEFKDRCDVVPEHTTDAANKISSRSGSPLVVQMYLIRLFVMNYPVFLKMKHFSGHAAEPPAHIQHLRKEVKGSGKVMPKSHRCDSTCGKERKAGCESSDTIRIIKAKLKNLTKKRAVVETNADVPSNPTNDSASTTESPKSAELRENIEKQRRLFKQVVEKGIAIYQENQMKNPGSNSAKAAIEKSDDRKVPPLRLRIVRSESGTIAYEIVKPKVELHFKRSLLKSKSIFKISSKKAAGSLEGDEDPESVEMSVKSLTSRSASRKQEPLRSKKVASMPYLASDLMRNSYTVLTACMNGRAHPNLIGEEDTRENNVNATSLADLSAKQTVNEVIWQQLFSKDGIIGRQAEKDEKTIRTKN